MSWLYVPASVESVLVSGKQVLEPSAMSRKTHTVLKSSKHVLEIDTLMMPLFGTILLHSTESPGVDSWIFSLRVSRVNHSVWQESDRGETMNDISGLISSISFATLDPASSSWKTCQVYLFQMEMRGEEDQPRLETFLQTWPRAGISHNGKAYRLRPLAPRTFETVYSFLPTIGKNEYKGSSRERYRGSKSFHGAKMSEGLRTCESDPIYLHPSFAELAMGFPIGYSDLKPLEMQ